MHEILRKEHRVKDGVDEVFLHIEVTTEDDVFTKAAWLSPADVASYLADESHIEVVAGKLKNKAKNTTSEATARRIKSSRHGSC